MPFNLLRRQFIQRFFAPRQEQTPAPARPAPQGETLAEQEESLRPPEAPPARPEWETFLNGDASANTNADAAQDHAPNPADVAAAETEAPGQTAEQTPPAPPPPPPTLVEEVRRRGVWPEFEAMWKAHPRNNGSAESVTSRQVNEDQGWNPDAYANTCAIRISVMLNKLGGDMKITRERAVAAGIRSDRVFYSRKTKWYYLLAASEIAQYVGHYAGKPSVSLPRTGRYRDAAAFNADYDSLIMPAIRGKQGFVFFERIFGFSGTGHVDIFDDTTLSAAGSWYPCQVLKVWYV